MATPTVTFGCSINQIAPKNIAELKESYFTNIAITPLLDEPYRVSSAMRTNSPLLARTKDAGSRTSPRKPVSSWFSRRLFRWRKKAFASIPRSPICGGAWASRSICAATRTAPRS